MCIQLYGSVFYSVTCSKRHYDGGGGCSVDRGYSKVVEKPTTLTPDEDLILVEYSNSFMLHHVVSLLHLMLLLHNKRHNN